MKGLIIEGPDGAGKSFTALELSRAVKLPIHHAGGPPKTEEELISRINNLNRLEGKILDRYPVISDLVYAEVLRDGSLIHESMLKEIPFPVIYCSPSTETILKAKLVTKPHKNEAHLVEVVNNINEIINRYDYIMGKIPHIVFNRDKQSCADLISFVEKIMS